MSVQTPKKRFLPRPLTSSVGLALIGNLSISIGLLPWLTLSARGQAVLLETNPAPAAPTFEIPTEVAPIAPEPVAPEPIAPAVSYEPEPYIAPEPTVEPVAPEPIYEPEPYVEAAPAVPSELIPNVETPAVPEIVAQPAPIPVVPSPSGCAALLDLSVAPGTGCGSAEPEVEAAPARPQPSAPAVIADEPAPPARQTQPAVAQGIPPARQLTAAAPNQSLTRPVKPVIPTYSAPPVSPSYTAAVPPAPPVRSSAPVAVTVPPAVQTAPLTQPRFTVVKPDRYRLKPVDRNPLQWVAGNQSLLFPLPFPVAVSSAFGWRQHPIQQHWHLHSGIDFAAEEGTPVIAAYDGKVELANYVGGYGLSVFLDHQKGERQTRYAHLSEIYVRAGQKVAQGDVIGAVGSTGNSTGPHLHFETLVKTPDGMVVVDPTEEVRLALVKSLEQMQAIAKQNRQPDNSSAAAPNRPVPTAFERQSQVRYQANANLSRPYLAE